MLILNIWRIDLDTVPDSLLPPPTSEESERAARLVTADLARRYLAAHLSMRAILRRELGLDPRIAASENGKPWLPDQPHCRFNLSHSRGTALVGVARDVDVGVDVEWIHEYRDRDVIVERFFPPSEAAGYFAAPEEIRALEFFRRWTRLEAMWKALGIGLHGAGKEVEPGPWTVEELDLGEGLAGAAAARAEGMQMMLHVFK
jgi:4'-phosphopantetheinyl transferase